MNLNQLNYAVKLSEFKNFTSAANELFITQPTLSQQIKSLEEELSVALFIRKRKGIELTPAGKDFIFYARKILIEIDRLNIAIGNYCTLEKGSIKIGLLWTFGYLEIGEYINQFRIIYPLIDIKLFVDGSTKLMEKLHNHELDVVFVTGSQRELDDHRLSLLKVAESEIAVIMNKNHHLAKHKSITCHDLMNENIMMVSRYSNVYPDLKKVFDDENIEMNIIGESSQTDICMQVADSGIGLSFVSFQTARSFHNNTTAVIFEPTIKRIVYLATLKESEGSSVISTFTDYIASHYVNYLG